jgi:membrane protease YdiL (CAAX protease family)
VTAIVAVPVGVSVAVCLFAVLARQLPVRPRARALARGAVIVPSACVEEFIWRLAALGGLRPLLGPVAALSLSSLGFALMHWRQAGAQSLRVHLVTGGAFGAAFLLTGTLAAAIVAHASYNLLVAAAVERNMPP